MNKSTVIKSLIYKTVERFSVKGLGFVISILLARMLSPEVFGQIALVTVVINLSQSIIEGGLGTALVQNKDVDEGDYSTVFYICMAMSVLITAVVFAGAPLVAGYYKSPEMLLPLRVYIFSVFFSSYASILMARMQREMRFKQILYCSLTATCVSGALAVALAFAGAGIWTLVVYYFSHTVVNCLAMFVAVRWRPKFTFSVERAKVLYSFGWKMLASSLMCSLYYDLRSLIIGKRISTEALGYYDRGFQVPFVISSAIDSSVQSVMFPVLAKSQDKKNEATALLRRSLTVSALLIIPAMVGLAAISDTFIRLLLTEKWLPSVPIMEVLCIGQAASALTAPNLVAIKAMGRSDIYMKLEFVRRVAMLIVLLVTVLLTNSIMAMAYSYTFSCWIDAVLCALPNGRLLGYGAGKQFGEVWKIIVAASVMAVAVWAVGLLALPMVIKLLAQMLAGVIIYAVLCWAMKIEGFLYALNMIKGLRRA